MHKVNGDMSQSEWSLGELLVVVYAEGGEEYRLICARRATPKERRAYEN